MRIRVAVGLLGLAGIGWTGALAAPCANTCTTPDVTIVYDGATAPIPSINAAAVTLYGDPTADCGANIRTYQCKVDLDNNGTPDTCVRLYVGQGRGSCEGVGELDTRDGTQFNVCVNGSGNPGTKVIASTLTNELGQPLYANTACADVSYTLCQAVETINRPYVFDSTGAQVFVNPFVMVANKAIEAAAKAAGKSNPQTTCPVGPPATDCTKLLFGVTATQAQGIFGNNNVCDWRWISQQIDGSTFRNIGTVMRNRFSGTRRDFQATLLQTVAPGQGNEYVAGSSDMLNYVNNNWWCGDGVHVGPGSLCGENQSTGATGGGSVSAACDTSKPVIDMGYVGTSNLQIVDGGTPADPFDDFPIRKNSSDQYDALQYNGWHYNKAAVECGRYEFWSQENNYYDNDDGSISGTPGYYFPPGSVKEQAVLQLRNAFISQAVNDSTVVANSQMLVTRAKDGGPIFPNKPFSSTICSEP